MVGTRSMALLALLKMWMPVIEAHVEASHLTDGFKRKNNDWDSLLEATKVTMKEADHERD